MNQDAKRRKIYTHLRHDLESSGLPVTGSDSLVCPLCWSNVAFESLTLEHVIPKSLGGRRETLTCRNCNESNGRELDNHLVGYQRHSEAWAGHGELKMDLDVNGHRVAARMTCDRAKPSTDFRVIGPASDPLEIDATQKDFAGGAREFTATFSMGYNERRRQLAILKAGYLALFHRFGYRLIARPGLQHLRKIIAGRQESEPDLSGTSGEAQLSVEFPGKQVIYMVANIDEKLAAWIIFRCRLRTTVHRFVILPIDETSSDFYMHLAQNARMQGQTSFKITATFDAI
jgi:HNH endonuclease